MGELFALLAASLFAFTNVMIKRGTTPASKDNGAFVSIVLTAAISGIFVIVFGLARGFPSLSTEGLLWFALAGFLTAYIGRVLQFTSIQYIGAVRASAIKRLIPFYSVILGALLLGETITIPLFIGMMFVLSGILMLIVQTFSKSNPIGKEKDNTEAAAAEIKVSFSGKVKAGLFLAGNLGYFYSPVSALAYSFGYIARKKGLIEIPDPFFGAMLGACTGIIIYALIALFRANYRYAVISAFTTFRPWFVSAGIMNSFGQISYFVALSYTTVTRVSLISSLEVFITMFLSVWIFKTKEHVNLFVVVACIISMIGSVIIIFS